MLSYIRIALLGASIAIGVAGAGWGWLKSSEAAGAAAEVAKLSQDLLDQKAALRAAERAQRALSARIATQQLLDKEKAEYDRLDKEALATVPEWSSTPVPPAVRDRLLDRTGPAPGSPAP